MDVTNLTIKEARGALRKKETTARKLAQAHLDILAKENKEINALVEVYADVLHQADIADERLVKEGESAPDLCGIPIAIKDNILLKGKLATAGSKILEGYKAAYDSFAAQKLKEQGVVFLGRANMDEFAMGSSTESSVYGPTKNPRAKGRVPGGSSGGSAAVVSMHGALGALGSDTGGSVRLPASFCGVVGLKPTYGSVSRSGLIAMGSSLDVIGPIAKTVSDVEIIFNAIKGKDKKDGTSLPDGIYSTPEKKEKYTIGVPRSFMKEGIDEDVLANFEASLKELEAKGHTIVDVELPNLEYALAAYYIIMPAECSTNLERLDGIRYGFFQEGPTLLDDYVETRGAGFGREVKRRILLGSYVLSAGYVDAYYHKARAVKELIRKDFESAFSKVDAIATPTAPSPAFRIGEKSDPLSMYLTDIFTVPANLVGIPGISLPMKEVNRDGESLPVGMQLLAPHMHEETLFALGKEFLNEQ